MRVAVTAIAYLAPLPFFAVVFGVRLGWDPTEPVVGAMVGTSVVSSLTALVLLLARLGRPPPRLRRMLVTWNVAFLLLLLWAILQPK